MNNKKIKIKNFTPDEYRKLSKKDIDEMLDNNIPFKVSNLFQLEHNFSYCLELQRLYKDDEEIELTKLENKLLCLLVSNQNKFVDIETIKEVVWKGKDMSIFTMRNIIKKIRDKTYFDIIKSKSNHGYSIQR